LWAKVFVHLKPSCNEAIDQEDEEETRWRAIAKVVTAQSHYHQLKLVSSKFKHVFERHPQLSDQLIVAAANEGHLIPSVLLWLRHRSSSVHNFTAFCGGSTQEMVIAALSCPSPQLADTYLTGASKAAILGISAYTSLTHCNLARPAEGVLDLQPLQGLPCLQDLPLETGTFANVPVTAQLTFLYVAESQVTCAQDKGCVQTCSVWH